MRPWMSNITPPNWRSKAFVNYRAGRQDADQERRRSRSHLIDPLTDPSPGGYCMKDDHLVGRSREEDDTHSGRYTSSQSRVTATITTSSSKATSRKWNPMSRIIPKRRGLGPRRQSYQSNERCTETFTRLGDGSNKKKKKVKSAIHALRSPISILKNRSGRHSDDSALGPSLDECAESLRLDHAVIYPNVPTLNESSRPLQSSEILPPTTMAEYHSLRPSVPSSLYSSLSGSHSAWSINSQDVNVLIADERRDPEFQGHTTTTLSNLDILSFEEVDHMVDTRVATSVTTPNTAFSVWNAGLSSSAYVYKHDQMDFENSSSRGLLQSPDHGADAEADAEVILFSSEPSTCSNDDHEDFLASHRDVEEKEDIFSSYKTWSMFPPPEVKPPFGGVQEVDDVADAIDQMPSDGRPESNLSIHSLAFTNEVPLVVVVDTNTIRAEYPSRGLNCDECVSECDGSKTSAHHTTSTQTSALTWVSHGELGVTAATVAAASAEDQSVNQGVLKGEEQESGHFLDKEPPFEEIHAPTLSPVPMSCWCPPPPPLPRLSRMKETGPDSFTDDQKISWRKRTEMWLKGANVKKNLFDAELDDTAVISHESTDNPFAPDKDENDELHNRVDSTRSEGWIARDPPNTRNVSTPEVVDAAFHCGPRVLTAIDPDLASEHLTIEIAQSSEYVDFPTLSPFLRRGDYCRRHRSSSFVAPATVDVMATSTVTSELPVGIEDNSDSFGLGATGDLQIALSCLERRILNHRLELEKSLKSLDDLLESGQDGDLPAPLSVLSISTSGCRSSRRTELEFDVVSHNDQLPVSPSLDSLTENETTESSGDSTEHQSIASDDAKSETSEGMGGGFDCLAFFQPTSTKDDNSYIEENDELVGHRRSDNSYRPKKSKSFLRSARAKNGYFQVGTDLFETFQTVTRGGSSTVKKWIF